MSTYSLQNGRAVLAPYSLRKLEAYLLANGFDESEVIVTLPDDLEVARKIGIEVIYIY
jgi:hypothetical protein